MRTIRYYYDQLKETHPDQWNAFNAELARMNAIEHFKRFVLDEDPKGLVKKRFSVIFLVITSLPGVDAELVFQAAGLPLPINTKPSLDLVDKP